MATECREDTTRIMHLFVKLDGSSCPIGPSGVASLSMLSLQGFLSGGASIGVARIFILVNESRHCFDVTAPFYALTIGDGYFAGI